MRIGCATASRVSDITTKLKSGKYSAARDKYLMDVVIERLTGRASENYVSPAMEYGIETEPLARAAYEIAEDVEVYPGGLAYHPTIEWFSASPDGLVGAEGLLEVKCPNTSTHLAYLLEGEIPLNYMPIDADPRDKKAVEDSRPAAQRRARPQAQRSGWEPCRRAGGGERCGGERGCDADDRHGHAERQVESRRSGSLPSGRRRTAAGSSIALERWKCCAATGRAARPVRPQAPWRRSGAAAAVQSPSAWPGRCRRLSRSGDDADPGDAGFRQAPPSSAKVRRARPPQRR